MLEVVIAMTKNNLQHVVAENVGPSSGFTGVTSRRTISPLNILLNKWTFILKLRWCIPRYLIWSPLCRRTPIFILMKRVLNSQGTWQNFRVPSYRTPKFALPASLFIWPMALDLSAFINYASCIHANINPNSRPWGDWGQLLTFWSTNWPKSTIRS